MFSFSLQNIPLTSSGYGIFSSLETFLSENWLCRVSAQQSGQSSLCLHHDRHVWPIFRSPVPSPWALPLPSWSVRWSAFKPDVFVAGSSQQTSLSWIRWRLTPLVLRSQSAVSVLFKPLVHCSNSAHLIVWISLIYARIGRSRVIVQNVINHPYWSVCWTEIVKLVRRDIWINVAIFDRHYNRTLA